MVGGLGPRLNRHQSTSGGRPEISKGGGGGDAATVTRGVVKPKLGHAATKNLMRQGRLGPGEICPLIFGKLGGWAGRRGGPGCNFRRFQKKKPGEPKLISAGWRGTKVANIVRGPGTPDPSIKRDVFRVVCFFGDYPNRGGEEVFARTKTRWRQPTLQGAQVRAKHHQPQRWVNLGGAEGVPSKGTGVTGCSRGRINLEGLSAPKKQNLGPRGTGSRIVFKTPGAAKGPRGDFQTGGGPLPNPRTSGTRIFRGRDWPDKTPGA